MIKSKYTLTKREWDIMNILWESPEPLVASEIVKKQADLTINTVQAVLKKLLKNSFIRIADIVYSGTVLSRSYIYAVSPLSFELQKFTESIQSIPSGSLAASNYVSALTGSEKDSGKILEEIEQVELLLEKKKEQLKQPMQKE